MEWKRKCIWLGIGVDLGFQNKFYKGLEINNGLRKRCNELWGGDDWNNLSSVFGVRS